MITVFEIDIESFQPMWFIEGFISQVLTEHDIDLFQFLEMTFSQNFYPRVFDLTVNLFKKYLRNSRILNLSHLALSIDLKVFFFIGIYTQIMIDVHK